jgi:hypothetical protein
VNPIDYRKNLAAFVLQMQQKQGLTDLQFKYLAEAFKKIVAGEDANKVLGLNYSAGNGPNKALTRQKMSLVLHWIACAIEPINRDGLGYTLEKACVEAQTLAQTLFGVSGSEQYDASYLKKCWYKPENAHMRSPTRNHFDPDSPV